MRSWAIGIVVTGRERLVQNMIAEEQQLECWYPVGQTLTKPKNKHQPVRVVYPVFHGYIFVAYNPDKLYSLLHNDRYSSLLGYIMSGVEIFAVEDEIVDDIRGRELSGEFDQLLEALRQRKSFAKGDKVLISNSVLGAHINNKVGIVLENAVNKVSVLVSVNGLKVKISVSFAEKIA